MSGRNLWRRIALLAALFASPGVMRAEDAPATAPDSEATTGLVTQLSGSDSLAREAAIRRLAPWPGAVAPAVVQLFAAGNLQSRLTAMELLQVWKAPIEQMDPWAPETITPERLAALRMWATKSVPSATQPVTSAQAIDPEEIGALLRAGTPAEACVITERLARAGPALLPVVAQRLKAASSDRDVERLTTLRYRIVSTDALAADWPDGLARLASRDARTRHIAVEQLGQRAKPVDAPLLIELFPDPDPLMRESSLRALQTIGGPDASRAMVRLLRDPEPNVRAAVLKELAESPSPDMVADVMAYVATEKDPDLVVHAVRVLRAAQSTAAEKCLVTLFSHPSWRVRAEAVDGLADSRQKRASSNSENDTSGDNDLELALIKLMDDPDGYVAGRAIAAMQAIGGRLADLQPMIDAAKRHPKLALDVIRVLARERSSDVKSQKALRSFFAYEDPGVRVAALRALVGVASGDCQKEITAAMSDSNPELRRAGADGLFQAIESGRPQNGYVDKPAVLGLFGGGRVKIDTDTWLDDFRAGKERPPWMGTLIPQLQKMLASSDATEQFTAAFPLVAMGHDAEAMPVVMKLIRTDLARRDTACWLLPWLPWDKRLAHFNAILNMEGGINSSILRHLTEHMVIWPDARAAEPLWTILARSDGESLLEPVGEALRTIYTQAQQDDAQPPPASQPSPIELLKTKATSGSVAQRTAALALLVVISAPDAAAVAKPMYESAATPMGLRADAFHIFLLSQQPESEPAAVAGLAAKTADVRLLSLRFLAQGADNLGEYHDMYWVRDYSPNQQMEPWQNAQPETIVAPPGLTSDALQPSLKSGDAESEALAGYLLCVLGQKSGLDPLVAYWRSNKKEGRSSDVDALVYGAISALDDDSKTPILAEIYAAFDKHDGDLKRFYWTIRPMHGPNVLALRKKIRDEVGMEQLR